MFHVFCSSTYHQRSLLNRCYLVFFVSSLLNFNLPSWITANQLLLSISCFMFPSLQRAINDHCTPPASMYSLFQACCISIYHQRSLPSRCYLVFFVSSLLHFSLPSMITANQQLLCIPCFMFASLQLVINDHWKPPVSLYLLFQACCISIYHQRSLPSR